MARKIDGTLIERKCAQWKSTGHVETRTGTSTSSDDKLKNNTYW